MTSNLENRQTTTPATRSPDARDRFRDEFDSLLSRFWNGPKGSWLTGSFAPSMDLAETDNAFEIRMDIPGVDAKEIDVKVQGNVITVSGHRKEEKVENGKTFHRVERNSGAFSRSMTLPCHINEDEVAADYTSGVLTVKLPKCDKAKGKKISVKG